MGFKLIDERCNSCKLRDNGKVCAKCYKDWSKALKLADRKENDKRR